MADRAEDFVQQLRGGGVRVISDPRENYTPGWKYNHWELKVHPHSLPPHLLDNLLSTALCVYTSHMYTHAQQTITHSQLADMYAQQIPYTFVRTAWYIQSTPLMM